MYIVLAASTLFMEKLMQSSPFAGASLRPRGGTYAHPSWLAPYLSGNSRCHKALHARANFYFSKDSIPESWATEHERGVQSLASFYESQGRLVTLEQQNSFKTASPTGVSLSGQMDLVVGETSDQPATIADVKTGKPRPSHRAQVLLYMALAPHLPEFRNITKPPSGVIYYSSTNEIVEIPAEEANSQFKQQVADLLCIAVGESPQTTPSMQDCRFCVFRDCCPDVVLAETSAVTVDWL